MANITIDGKQYEVKENKTILQVATELGIEIPFFCWHPNLSLSGNCRMCLVEVEKMPKLVISCMTRVNDGMVVQTRSERVIKAREAVMEFLLINHPLDCPICDEAGECKLQDYAYAHSTGSSRFDERKVHKPKRVPLGPYVMFDAERCILCSRCIRFCDEIAGKTQLHFVQRGDHTTIETFPGEELDNPYSMNTIDICPVGALTSRDFRFRSRVWEMSSTESVCVGCARGCNTYLGTRNNQILRLTPRINDDVNQHWMCDYGRLNTYKFVNDDLRIRGPFIRVEGEPVEVSWKKGIETAGNRLKGIKSKEIVVIASPFATNEDNYILKKLARETLKGGKISCIEPDMSGEEDDILMKADRTPNNTGLKLLGILDDPAVISFDEMLKSINEKKIKCLIVLNGDIIRDDNTLNILKKLNLMIAISWSHNKTTELADIVLSSTTYAETAGTITNFEGRVQLLNPGIKTKGELRGGFGSSRLDRFGTKFDRWGRGPVRDAHPGWQILSDLARKMGDKFPYHRSEEVFEEIAKKIEPFRGLSYAKLGNKGALAGGKDRVKSRSRSESTMS